MNEIQKLLPRDLKDAATAAFCNNLNLKFMTLEQREAAARAYEQIAEITIGENAGLAKL